MPQDKQPMSAATRENTITGRVAAYLREEGVPVDTFKGVERPGRKHPVEPDFTVEDGGRFFGEAKWEGDYFQAIAEARDYGLIPSNGAFAIGYPEELRQRRLEDYSEGGGLAECEFRVAFLRPDQETEMTRLSIEDLPQWLWDHINEDAEPKTDPEEAVDVLRQTAAALAEPFDDIETPDLFRNVLGVTPGEAEQEKAAKQAAGYLLIDQILFYRVLSSVKRYQDLNPESLGSPSDLQTYFADVLEDDYAPIFAFPVAEVYPQEELPLLKAAIKSIYGLAPDQLNHEVLGTVFHELTPPSVRKPLGAYYTKNKAAELLAGLSIEKATDTVIDPSCGSGTLLTAAYRRKRKLTSNFTETDHARFLEEEITGVDIMPFAAHLSTIHLALEQPVYQTNKVRIGIDDATKLEPGDSISPLSYVLPESVTGQKSIVDFIGDMNWKDETIEKGSITLDGRESDGIDLDTVDAVIMNPPFSRQESVAQFNSEYKQNLKERFKQQSEHIHGKMAFSSYFILLADKFLSEGGKLAAVLPASFLNKMSDGGVRELLLDRYNIEYLITRQDQSNFSEDTDFREILLIAEKDPSAATDIISVSLDGLKSTPADIERLAAVVSSETDETITSSNESAIVRRLPRDTLEPHNLFAPLSVENYELFDLWNRIRTKNRLTRIEDAGMKIFGGLGYGGNAPEWIAGIINNPAGELQDNDLWVLEAESENAVIAKHRMVKETVEIPRDCLVSDFHRYAHRSPMDASDLHEYAIVEEFEGIGRFLELSDADRIPDKWARLYEKRLSHVGFMRRLNLASPGTRHLAYYTDTPRTFHNMMWVLPEIDQERAQQLTLWLNSSLNLVQMLINRVPRDGAYTTYHRHTISHFRVPELDNTAAPPNQTLNQTFTEIANEEFPSLVEQLAQNIPQNGLSTEQKKRAAEHFEGIESELGKGFTPRRTIDRAVLDFLDVPARKQDELLSLLYPALFSELVALKRLMD